MLQYNIRVSELEEEYKYCFYTSMFWGLHNLKKSVYLHVFITGHLMNVKQDHRRRLCNNLLSMCFRIKVWFMLIFIMFTCLVKLLACWYYFNYYYLAIPNVSTVHSYNFYQRKILLGIFSTRDIVLSVT